MNARNVLATLILATAVCAAAAAATATPAPSAAPAPSPTPVPAPAAPAPAARAPAAPPRNIGGPGDYPLREKIMHLISRDPDLPKESFNVILVNGGAVYSGEIRNWTLKKRALSVAATTRGIVNVTDEMTVPRGDVTDAELAKAVTSLLSDVATNLELRDLDVRVDDGVLTLAGKVRDVAARGRAEDVAGTVFGVTRISNHLLPANAPSGADDASLQKAVIAYLADFRAFAYPSELTVKVAQGVVTLRGRANLYMGRQQAAIVASLVKGVSRVDNRIKVDPSILPRDTRVQAEPR